MSADHETPDGEYTDTNNKPVTIVPIEVTIDDKEKLDKIHAENDLKFPLAGTCSEEGYAVDVRIGTASVTPKPKCQSGKWSAEMDLRFLYDGAEAEKFTFGIAATHSSLSGASKDTTASVSKVGVYMHEPAKEVIDSSNETNFVVAGKCSENNQDVVVTVQGRSLSKTVNCGDNKWTVDVDLSDRVQFPTGEVIIAANHSDSGGLKAKEVTRSVKRGASVTIAEVNVLGEITESGASAYPLSGTCSEIGRPVVIKVEKGEEQAQQSPSPQQDGGGVSDVVASSVPSKSTQCEDDSTWTVDVDLSDRIKFPTGPVVITANHRVDDTVDAPVAPEAKRIVRKLPDVTIGDLADITNENAGTYVISGTCTEADVNVKVTVSKSSDSVKETIKCKVVEVGSLEGIWEVEVDISGSGFSTGKLNVKAEHEKGSGKNAWVAPIVAGRNQKSVNRRAHVSIKQDLGDINVGNGGTFTVSGSCSETGRSVSVTVTGTGSGSVTTTISCSSSGSWEWVVPMGSDRAKFPTGPVTITVDQTDTTGNLNAPQKTITVNRKPLVTIASAVGDIKHGNSTGYTAYPLSGTCTENTKEVTVTVTQGSDSATPTTQPICGSDTADEWSATVDVSSLATRFVNIEVAHNNGGSGNLALAASPASKAVKKLPHVSIKTPLPKVTDGNKGSYPLSGDCSEDGVNVVLTVTGFSSSSVSCGANSRSGEWSTTVNLGSVGVGAIDITADHKKTIDAVEFPAPPASDRISKLPVVTIVTAPSINAGTYTLSGTCTENGQPVTVSVGGVPPGTQPTCSSGNWEVTSLDVSSLGTGEITITADHSTGGGTLGAPQVSKKVDKLPSVTVASNTSVINDKTSIDLSGTCSEAEQTVTIKLVGEGKSDSDALTSAGANGGAGINCAVGNTWTWSSVDISNRVKFPTGPLTITADHSVSLGSSPAKTYGAPSKKITVKRNPVVTITHRPVPDPDNSVLPVSAPHITNGNMADYPLSGTCTEDGEDVKVTLSRGVEKLLLTTVSCTGRWNMVCDRV